MSTHNKLFERMLNYVFNVELFVKTYATIYNIQLTLTFWGLGFLKKINKVYIYIYIYIYIYENRKENIPLMG